MATLYWTGAAQKVAGVLSVTPANVGIGNTFTVTFVGGRVFTFTATAATVANVTAGLLALLQASTDPLITELTFSDETTYLKVTGQPGKSLFLSSSASGGTATNTTATVTAATGPNFWTNVKNWSTGAVPVDGDTVILANTDVSILYDIDSGQVNLSTGLAELRIEASFTGEIGLPERDPADYANTGYRPTFLQCPATLINIGVGSGSGSGRLKLSGGTVTSTVTVYSTGQPVENGVKAVVWFGVNASNVVNVLSGSVGICTVPHYSGTYSGVATTVATVRVGGGNDSQPPDVEIGAGVTLTTVTQLGGVVVCRVAATTITKTDGTFTLIGTGAVTTLTNDGGLFDHRSSGTITTLNNSTGGVFTFSNDMRPVTVTNCNLYHESETYDRGKRVTWSNPIALVRCSLADIKLDTGTGATLQPA